MSSETNGEDWSLLAFLAGIAVITALEYSKQFDLIVSLFEGK
jgi:hypothetical protein